MWHENLKLGEPRFIRNLFIVPVIGSNGNGTDIVTLREAQANNWVRISEASSPTVPTIHIAYDGPNPLYLIDGEEIVGGYQNRILNTAALIAEHSEVDVPVSCVERSRWSGELTFAAGNTTSYPSLRAMLLEDVTQSLRATRRFDTNQSRIWDSVAHTLESLKVRSRTQSLHDAFTKLRDLLEEYCKEFESNPHYVGMIVKMGNKCFADIFASPTLFDKYLPQLLESYALESIAFAAPTSADIDTLREFFNTIWEDGWETYPGVGIAHEARKLNDKVAARMTLHGEGNPIHLFAAAR